MPAFKCILAPPDTGPALRVASHTGCWCERGLDPIWNSAEWVGTPTFLVCRFLEKPKSIIYLPKKLIENPPFSYTCRLLPGPGTPPGLEDAEGKPESGRFGVVVKPADPTVWARVSLISVLPGRCCSLYRSVIMENGCLLRRNRKWPFPGADFRQSYLFCYVF